MHHGSICFENLSCWRNKRIALGNTSATCVAISVCALPIITRYLIRAMLNDEAFGALVCATVTFLTTTFVEIGVGAIFITTKNIRSIGP